MKFVSLFLSGLVGLAAAQSLDATEFHELVRRDQVTVIETALYNISNYTAALNDEIKNFNILQLQALNTATLNSVNAIVSGDAACKKIQPITTSDALLLTPIFNNLVPLVEDSINNTIAQKANLGGLAPVVLQSLKTQQQATLAFSTTVSGKLPPALVAYSLKLNQPIFDALTRGVSEFQKTTVNTDKSVYSSGTATKFASSWGTIALAMVVGSLLL